MRWDNQLLEPPQGETARLPLFAEDAIVRRFNTPEFKGMTFYEVQAKSILNHVKPNNMGFNWTINPYRGCSHACSYCLAGDTPILLANGRTKPLADVRVGDRVYGTVAEGAYRRFVTTEVIDHWSTVKPAYRILLEDGTTVIASGEHRFLTERGWKHVSGAAGGPHGRPHLTRTDHLLGTGHLAEAPKGSVEYEIGYLTGMIRGDANLKAYEYARAGRAHGNVAGFRPASIDLEAVRRTKLFLEGQGIHTTESLLAVAGGNRKRINAIRTQPAASVARLQEIVRTPGWPSEDWRKGFLGGIFDAGGSYSGGVLRITNGDRELIELTKDCLEALGFRSVVEARDLAKPMYCVRIVGGVVEHLRFFLGTDPAITRKRTLEGSAIKCRASLRVAGISALGIEIPMYDVTTGTGDFIANGVVSHNCFARPTHTYLDLNAGVDFEAKIVVKVNAVELLRRELRKPSWAREHVAMGTNTDNYQRAEGRYRLMRGILGELNAIRNPYSILTKSTLIQRDIDLLVEGAAVADVSASFSVGTVDEEVWRRTEPGTPSPLKRLEVLRKLNEAGVPCGILMAPILPGISDSPVQLAATVKAAAAAGATHITPLVLHLRPGVKEEFLPWLEREYPELMSSYLKTYRGSNAPKAVAEPIQKAVYALRDQHGAGRCGHRDNGAAPVKKPEPAPEAEQLALDFGSEPVRKAPTWVAAPVKQGPAKPARKKRTDSG